MQMLNQTGVKTARAAGVSVLANPIFIKLSAALAGALLVLAAAAIFIGFLI